MRRPTTSPLTVLAILLSASLSYANEGDCLGFEGLEADTKLSLGVVSESAARVNFVKNAGDRKGCPGNGPECREKGYLVPGDQVIVSATHQDFVCADYVNPKGLVRAGWLPRTAVSILPDQPASRPEDWLGLWSGPEQSVDIEKGPRSGEVRIKGEATYGSLDPARVARGAVNSGAIEGIVKPEGSSLAFTMGDDKTLPYTEGGDYDCRVRMRLLGPFLVVKDNNSCGGMNVSFTGAYRRKK